MEKLDASGVDVFVLDIDPVIRKLAAFFFYRQFSC